MLRLDMNNRSSRNPTCSRGTLGNILRCLHSLALTDGKLFTFAVITMLASKFRILALL